MIFLLAVKWAIYLEVMVGHRFLASSISMSKSIFTQKETNLLIA
jgi:hypothetical protein